MGLSEYRRKRNFRRTREPRGKKTTDAGGLFVIQKHDASRLHYDFRLELGGVLKSWAVPKGPSLDPGQKRLAVQVEDHPLEYGSFEGTIPAGEYGGGTVLLWDRGTWEPVGDAAEGLRAGKLKFRLKGEKLSGGWLLVRSGGQRRDPKRWLLIKERDEAARSIRDYDATSEEPLSVFSGRDLKQIAAEKDRAWKSSRSDPVATGAALKSQRPSKATAATRRFKSNLLPHAFKPQLATLVERPPEGPQWLHEIKFDGYRILAGVNGPEVRLQSRNGLDWTPKFPAIAEAVGKLNLRNAVLDGEVVVLNQRGVSDFQALQRAIHEHRRGALIYYVFDLLWLDGEDLRELPLIERKLRLESLKLPSDRGPIRFTEHFTGDGAEFFAQVELLGLEGIVSKRRDQPHRDGRGPGWQKIKCAATDDFVIGGFTNPAGARHDFGALLLGYYERPGKLKFAGRVGTGFDDACLGNLGKRLRGIQVEKSPFSGPTTKYGAHWVRPSLVAQVKFTNWTRDGRLRHPVFLGLREDKPARTVHREMVRKPSKIARTGNAKEISPAISLRLAKNGRCAYPSVDGESSIAGERLTHPDKLLYPKDGITKRMLAEYYVAISEWMLPQVADRPLSIVRCPEGLGGASFFQKHPTFGTLERLKRVRVPEKGVEREYVAVQDSADLVALVQIGALEIHAWGSRIRAVERPDRLMFDLDPAPDVPWPRVISAAVRIRDFFEELGLESFVKTSGGKGLHIVVPIAARHDWNFVDHFCHAIALAIVRAAPNEFVATMSKKNRSGKIFVDYLRNQRGATAIAPYSTRARTGAPVSMPLTWKELAGITSADQFRVSNIGRRVTTLKRRDPWIGIAEVRQTLTKSMLKQINA